MKKYLSLFTGIAGFELGIIKAYENNRGFLQKQATENLRKDLSDPSGGSDRPTCIGYSEIDKYAIQIYQKHFPKHKNYGNITKIKADELPDFDFLCGGFPCQSFSIAGKRRGFYDTRGTLFFDIARILKSKKPTRFLLENVKGLISHDDGNTFKTIIATLIELGYDVQWQVLNSKDFGVPQNRERVFIVGHIRGTPRPQVFPFGEIETGTHDPGSSEKKIANAITTRQTRFDDSQNYVVPTLRASDSKRGDNQTTVAEDGMKIRRLTPTECERLQGFPDGWTKDVSDTQRYKTLGNAVTVNVIQAIIEKLLIS